MLEEYLGNPEIAVHALVYFQLRAVWRTAVRAGRAVRRSNCSSSRRIASSAGK